jgi:UDP-glucose 4-epimerase
MSHCCVIGGTGFIGSHLLELLHATGRVLTVIGRNALPTRPLPPGTRYLAGDYADSYFLMGALQGVDEVIMLAYTTVPKSSFEDPVRDILDNLPAPVKLFEMACSLELKKLVFVSSGGTVYGKSLYLPIREDHPTNPISPYGITKLATEHYAFMFRELAGLPVVSVRPGNAYGEGQKPFVGQGFVATAIASILQEKEITLFGESGTVRDYVHVSDVAQGIVAALEKGRPGVCYNIGSGIGRSNRDILDAISPFAVAAGLEVKVKAAPLRMFDVPANVLDCARLEAETGWKPLVPFADGMARAWDWFHRNFQ